MATQNALAVRASRGSTGGSRGILDNNLFLCISPSAAPTGASRTCGESSFTTETRSRSTGRCAHFNGDVSHETCALGIPYASVQIPAGRSYRLPCVVSESCSEHCARFEVREVTA